MSAANGFQWELRTKLADEALARQSAFRLRLADICQQGMDEGIFKRGVPAELLATNILAIPHPILAQWLEKEISAMDLNPVMVLPRGQGVRIVDIVINAG